jgi:hypothetical protein
LAIRSPLESGLPRSYLFISKSTDAHLTHPITYFYTQHTKGKTEIYTTEKRESEETVTIIFYKSKQHR